MKLMRFKDNTFAWISDADASISPILTEKEAIAFGVWNLKILKPEVKMGLDNLKLYNHIKKDNVAVFGTNNKLYLYTMKLVGDVSF